MDLSNLDLGGDLEDDPSETPRPSAGPSSLDALLASMLSQMQLLQHQVSALAGGRPSDSRSRDRLPDSSFKPGEIAELMKEGFPLQAEGPHEE